MSSTFTTNKHIEKPASGDYNNAWAAPVNADWDDIDNALGGSSGINVTGVGAGTIALTLSQYQPPNMSFSGTIGSNLNYQLPAGVGGVWSIQNATTGGGSLTISVSGGGSLVMPQGFRTLIVCDGSNVQLADTAPAQAALNAAEAFATAADTVVLANADSFATAAANNAQAAAVATAANASNLSSGTVPNGRLPNIGAMPGVTIAADPGTVPTGAAGDIWLYY